jgi:hypothetical protein
MNLGASWQRGCKGGNFYAQDMPACCNLAHQGHWHIELIELEIVWIAPPLTAAFLPAPSAIILLQQHAVVETTSKEKPRTCFRSRANLELDFLSLQNWASFKPA